jgi:hypothetical protein
MTQHTRSNGSRLFRAFLDRNRITMATAAAALHCSSFAIHSWYHGVRKPRAIMRIGIEVWTGGLVPRDAWDADRRILESITPYAGTAA